VEETSNATSGHKARFISDLLSVGFNRRARLNFHSIFIPYCSVVFLFSFSIDLLVWFVQ